MMRPMKDSGIEWIGKIPEGWGEVMLSSLFCEHKQKNEGMQCNNLLSLSYGKIIRKSIDTSEGLLPGSFEGYNIIDKGDIVLRLTDLQNDHKSLRTGLATERGIITSAYVTIRLDVNEIASSKYMHYFLHSFDVAKGFYGMGDGVRQSLPFEGCKKITLLLPPLAEQQAIADYLDEKCAAIDKLIDNQKAQIEKMKEYKQSVITEAVTKGLNPSVPMKDSGIAWIGKIPEGWETCQAKFVILQNDGGVWGEDLAEGKEGKFVIRSTEQTEEGKWSIVDPAQRDLSNVSYSRYRILPNDLLITKSSGSALHIGKTTIADQYFLDHECYYSNFIQRVRVNDKKVFPKYAWYLYNSPLTRDQFVYLQNSTSGIGNINADNIKSVIIPIPPLAEQQAIADYLDEKCAAIDKSIAIKQAKIDKLNDYKKSLIYEYVTGKREVL